MARLSPIRRLPRARRGQKIPAAHHNALADAIESGFTIAAGRGIAVAPFPGGVRVSSSEGVREFWCRVTAVHGVPGGGMTPQKIAPSDRRYTVATDDGQFVLEQAAPTLGLPVFEDEALVWTAKIGDRCKVVRTLDDDGLVTVDLWILTEYAARKRCKRGG